MLARAHRLMASGSEKLGLADHRLTGVRSSGRSNPVTTSPSTRCSVPTCPGGDEAAGLGAGHVRAFLPIWLQKTFGDWKTYGGGGFWINDAIATKDQDYWFFGWAVERKITDKLRLGGEIFHQTADKIGGRDSTGLNVGVLYDLNEHNHLLFSAGRGIQNASETNRFSWYIAYQITGP